MDIEPGQAWYCFHEFKYAVASVVEWARQSHPRKLPIDPVRNSQADKFKQLRVAGRYLTVPDWRFTCTPSTLVTDAPWAVKSLTGKPIPGTGDFAKVIYTSRVRPEQLADGFPWFMQRMIDAAFDLTVVYVDGAQFGFTLDRGLFSGLDWRRSISVPAVDEAWRRVDLPASLTAALQQVMADLGLRFGRIDLLAADRSCRDVWFLEVNPNGQWAWLDLTQTSRPHSR